MSGLWDGDPRAVLKHAPVCVELAEPRNPCSAFINMAPAIFLTISLAIEVDVGVITVPIIGALPHAVRMDPCMASPGFFVILCYIDDRGVDPMVSVSDHREVGETPALGR